jgi:hypothetical protein
MAVPKMVSLLRFVRINHILIARSHNPRLAHCRDGVLSFGDAEMAEFLAALEEVVGECKGALPARG